jgi:iron-sulfur cluster assembly accessory protein
MLQEFETTTIENINAVTMSASAVEAVRSILNERKLEGYSLRVYVSGGSCCGVNFGMALDNNARENDLTFRSDDVQVIVDSESIEYLKGAKIDYINDPVRGAGFTVDNPSKVKSGSCSCGSEGQTHSEEEGSNCACGGSCGCNN